MSRGINQRELSQDTNHTIPAKDVPAKMSQHQRHAVSEITFIDDEAIPDIVAVLPNDDCDGTAPFNQITDFHLAPSSYLSLG